MTVNSGPLIQGVQRSSMVVRTPMACRRGGVQDRASFLLAPKVCCGRCIFMFDQIDRGVTGEGRVGLGRVGCLQTLRHDDVYMYTVYSIQIHADTHRGHTFWAIYVEVHARGRLKRLR